MKYCLLLTLILSHHCFALDLCSIASSGDQEMIDSLDVLEKDSEDQFEIKDTTLSLTTKSLNNSCDLKSETLSGLTNNCQRVELEQDRVNCKNSALGIDIALSFEGNLTQPLLFHFNPGVSLMQLRLQRKLKREDLTQGIKKISGQELTLSANGMDFQATNLGQSIQVRTQGITQECEFIVINQNSISCGSEQLINF